MENIKTISSKYININKRDILNSKLTDELKEELIKDADSFTSNILKLRPLSSISIDQASKHMEHLKISIINTPYEIVNQISNLLNTPILQIKKLKFQGKANETINISYINTQIINIFKKHKKNIEKDCIELKNLLNTNSGKELELERKLELERELELKDVNNLLVQFHNEIVAASGILIKALETHFPIVNFPSTSANTDCEQTTEVTTTVELPESNSIDFTDTVDAEKSPIPTSPL